MALSDKRKYPVQQFREFWEIGRRYAELTRRDPMIHRSVVSAVNGLTDFVMPNASECLNRSFGTLSGWNP